jgi:hypothetical protein
MHRLTALVVIASLTTAPACLALAAPPAIGASAGAAIGMAVHHGNKHSSVTGYALAGLAVGVVVDLIAVAMIASALDNWEIGPTDRRLP